MDSPVDPREKENTEEIKSRIGWDTRPRPDEGAMWTLVSSVGQFVLVGWATSIGTLMFVLGWSFIQDPSGVPSWVNGLIASVFLLFGAGLMYFAVRMFVQALRTAWTAYRKMLFLLRYHAAPDPVRARNAAEGDPLLEPYLRFLVKRGFVKMNDPSIDRPL